MPGVGDLLGKIGIGGGSAASSGGGLMGNLIFILLGVIALCGCGFGLWFFLSRRKNWNIKGSSVR